jgi:predicted RNA-binding protein with TRAM domain
LQARNFTASSFDTGGLALEHPVITGETLPGAEDAALVMTPAMLLGNDTSANQLANPELPALSITSVGDAVNGFVAIVNGNVVFVPNPNFFGEASFSYTVTDQYGLSASATATLQIAAVNDAASVVGETIGGALEDQGLLIMGNALLANDSDVDNLQSSLTLSRVQSGTGGTVSLNGAGNVVFVPNANFHGAATFTYWVADPSGLESAPVTTTVLITAVNDAPTALGELITGAVEDAVLTIPLSLLTANDTDVDDVLGTTPEVLSLAWVGNAIGGTVTINGSGDVVFTPTPNFNGDATFEYRVRDAAGLESATVQAVIAVASTNDTPLAVDDLFATYVDSTMSIAFNQLTNNDIDADGDALTVSANDSAWRHAA